MLAQTYAMVNHAVLRASRVCAADLPVQLILEEACPESVFVHAGRHVCKESPVDMWLLCKDLLHALRSDLVAHLQHP